MGCAHEKVWFNLGYTYTYTHNTLTSFSQSCPKHTIQQFEADPFIDITPTIITRGMRAMGTGTWWWHAQSADNVGMVNAVVGRMSPFCCLLGLAGSFSLHWLRQPGSSRPKRLTSRVDKLLLPSNSKNSLSSASNLHQIRHHSLSLQTLRWRLNH